MASSKVIYLDMDGCLCDFVEGFINIHERDDLMEKYREGNWPSTWNFDGEFGELDTWWDKIDGVGEVFWSYLNAYHWTPRIIMELEASGIPWYICTTPRLTKTCFTGKLEWLEHHIGKFELIMAKDKWRLAHVDALLIDDNDSNIEKFHEAGGRTCLLAQPWNKNRDAIPQRIEHVVEAIKIFAEEFTLADV